MANSEKVSMFVSLNKITMKNNLLTQVKNKQKKRNIITESDLKLKMSEFILKIYDVCTPNKYGNVFPEKIIHDVGPRLKKMSPKLDRGDLHINYKKFFEVKISYKNIGEKYSITNIRDWQDLNYFILCFVDENFKPKYYCVPKDVVTCNPKISLTGMNNSKTINSYNTYVGKRTTIDANDIDWLFKSNNVLKGTTYTNLINFLKSPNIK